MIESVTRQVGQRYDRLADPYQKIFSPVIKPFASALTEFASFTGTVVDVGCGAGALADVWRDAGASRIVGLDASEVMLRSAPHERILADASLIPLRSSVADVSCSCFVLQFVAEPAAAVRAMARIARSSGLVATVTWGSGIDIIGEAELAAMLDEAGAPKQQPPVRNHHLVDSTDKMRAMFESAGLYVSVAIARRSSHQWGRDQLWQQLTSYGELHTRMQSLSQEARSDVLERARAMLNAIPDPDLTWTPEIVYVVGVKQ
ncbi:MAG: class I SAM-dependent methyltransferase [Actinomycetota bacterium]